MLDRFLKLLSGELKPADSESGPFERCFAALLVEATQFDATSTDEDRGRIVEILQSMFHFREEAAETARNIALARSAQVGGRDGEE